MLGNVHRAEHSPSTFPCAQWLNYSNVLGCGPRVEFIFLVNNTMCALVKLPMICRPFMGVLRKNGVEWNWRRGLHGLPQDSSVSYLRNSVNGAEVYLVGTCHVAEKSAQLVKQVIGFVNPNIIAVELCQRRVQSYQQLKPYQPSLLKLILNSWRFPGTLRAKLVQFSICLLYHILRVNGFEPGKEFKIALEECKRLEAQLLLIDEDIYVTVKNLGDVLSRRPYLRIIKDGEVPEQLAETLEIEELLENMTLRNFLRKLTERLIENTTQRNFVRKLTEQLTSEIPDIVRVILTQRDQMMFENLRKCKGKVVAVVGMAHMDGIEQMWKDIEQNL